ncbi:MAG: transposase [Acidobacteriaceae bacterium]|nr:transposase [Acidobacteriaceae bacterium]
MRPRREHATNNQQTYMVTASTWERRALFRNERWARLLLDTLYHYRGSAYLLHEFVIMPDHIHVLITPITSLEKAVQFIKGGFSYRARKELGSSMEIWHKGFQDHRIRDAQDYDIHVAYIRGNPMRKHLYVSAEDCPYCSAHSGFELDDVPQRLKPLALRATVGAPEGAPFQIQVAAAKAAPFQNVTIDAPAHQTGLVDGAAPELAPAPVQRKKASASTRERQTTNDQRRIHAQTH